MCFSGKNKILCRFVPLSINGVPKSKVSEYQKNLNETGMGFWTEFITVHGGHNYFKNLNGDYFFLAYTKKWGWFMEGKATKLESTINKEE